MIVDIPDELAERIWREAKAGRYDGSVVDHLAALLPAPDPLDVLAAEDGWERRGPLSVRWDHPAMYVYATDKGVTLWRDEFVDVGHTRPHLIDVPCGDPAAAVALARRLRAVLEAT